MNLTIRRVARSVQLTGLLCLVACGEQPSETGALVPQGLVGVWTLHQVAGASPMDLDIRAQTIDFVADGSWRSMTLMAGRWDGMRLEASGTWSLSGSTLTYTAGENRDATQISMDDGKLSLRPDLLVRRNGTDPVNATYVR